jgi:ribosomal protein L3
MWDQWGSFIPLTVIHLDRVQVTQIKAHPQEKNKL